jgi:hypothetical protein
MKDFIRAMQETIGEKPLTLAEAPKEMEQP